ncbi:hypothetical protein NLJ89_g7007 [Agrocybe chaxingu]|uniref:Uncharacterized protein n=1 Tax=Agrocybe chaxingu TaxID=84603 RepID=A0A9W8JY16_9AGAR|nr:hypothetical protein NLJ89_g7007 [Agrocybe chaxingu]
MSNTGSSEPSTSSSNIETPNDCEAREIFSKTLEESLWRQLIVYDDPEWESPCSSLWRGLDSAQRKVLINKIMQKIEFDETMDLGDQEAVDAWAITWALEVMCLIIYKTPRLRQRKAPPNELLRKAVARSAYTKGLAPDDQA